MIIGITGTIGAGKGTVAEYLVAQGFTHFSVRDFLREELSRRNLEATRDNMVVVANELRKNFGPAHILEMLYKQAREHGGNAVIESIRTAGEVDFLKAQEDFVLLAVDADRRVRYDRVVLRGSSTDNVTFEKFSEQEDLESNGSDPWTQNLANCIERSDIVMTNNGTIPELYAQVDVYLNNKK